jgi:cell division protein FtsI/penicillin-binding protein 2
LETLINWGLRAIWLAVGLGTGLAALRWAAIVLRERRERWAGRLAFGMLVLAGAYAVGHLWLLAHRERIEAGRMQYAVFGDPRLAEMRRAEVRGWILDCTGDDANALARYGTVGDTIRRVYPLGEAGANLIGGGAGAADRDYTVERLFSRWLREPKSWAELGQLHPAGSDLRLTLCRSTTREAWRLLQESGRPGVVVMQDVRTGGVMTYAATGRPEDAPLGIKRYAPPGSVFKLALAALWWDAELPVEAPIPCPPTIQVTPRAAISNAGRIGYGTIGSPREMLVVSCNTAAVTMALQMREQLGERAFVEAYRRFGLTPYFEGVPTGDETDFWVSDSDEWRRRMSPPPARIRIGEQSSRQEWAQLAIGQGPVDVTPIHISRLLQAIGNGGVMLPPTLEWERVENPVQGDRVMQETTANLLQQAMRETVERGTARSVAPRLRGVDWSLGGKTGTAQVSGRPDDGWFGGLVFDADGRPRYTVVVYLQGGGPGGGRPAAIAAEMTRWLARQQAEARS